VLFLDEFAEFSRAALEGLRQPLESGEVEVMRGQTATRFPASFMLIAACNECPCGRARPDCQCSEAQISRYMQRLSGPLLDRIDMICMVAAPQRDDLVAGIAPSGSSSPEIRARVVAARERQMARLAGTPALCNADMNGPLTRRLVRVTDDAKALLRSTDTTVALSGRGHDRVLRLARTIADLDGRDQITADDVAEAAGYKLNSLELAAA
jgi:magnesium chelatase family protein